MIKEDIKYIMNKIKNYQDSLSDNTIIVTGGAGFIGSWLCETLLEFNNQVICIDNFHSGIYTNISHLIKNKNFKLINHDISTPIKFHDKIDYILHFASRASPLEFSKFPIQILKANTLGTWISLGIAKEHNAPIILASSSEVYGDPDPKYIPTPEHYHGNVNILGIRGCYDEAKRGAEAFAKAYERQHNMDTRILRIHNTYGPRMRTGDIYGRVITRFIDQSLRNIPITIFGDGLQTRSFTYITDMLVGILKATFNPQISGEVINLGSDEEISILFLAKVIKELTNSESNFIYLELPQDDPKRRCPDITKAKRLLNLENEVSLQEGLRKTIMWMNKN